MAVKVGYIGYHGFHLFSRVIENKQMTSPGRYTLSKMRTFYSANQDGTAFKHVPVWNVFFLFERRGAVCGN